MRWKCCRTVKMIIHRLLIKIQCGISQSQHVEMPDDIFHGAASGTLKVRCLDQEILHGVPARIDFIVSAYFINVQGGTSPIKGTEGKSLCISLVILFKNCNDAPIA